MAAHFDSHDLVNYWKGRIEKDLTPFLDPGTTLTLSDSARLISAQWEQRQRNYEATFSVSLEAGVSVSFQQQTYSYKSFFASSPMADLLGLAKMITRTRTAPLFVETKARRLDQDRRASEAATSILTDALRDPSGEDATLVIMVTGEAGAGKTSVLQHLVKARAEQYTRGQEHSLFLYINAQGRALARFNEALATELMDLRATLTYHAVSALVRLGLVIPVIDGFDELLGVGGYDDAFSSLASFIEELDGSGRLVASARSTYYEQEFVARANRVSSLGSQVWRQIPVEVLAWGDAEFNEYVSIRSNQIASEKLPESFARDVERAFRGPNAHLKTKPLFVAKTVDLIANGTQLTGNNFLLDELVNAYLDRERTEKLLDRFGGSLLTHEQLENLLITLAEEMWNQETRELDQKAVREVAEYVLMTSSVDEATLRIVCERMTTLAFLATGERNGTATFEHEIFFAYFLAHKFAEALSKKDATLSGLLGRSVLPDEVAETTSRILLSSNPSAKVDSLIANLSEAGATHSVRGGQIRENAGSLTRVILSHYCRDNGPIRNLLLRNLVIPGGDLDRVELTNATFENVEFRRVNFSNCKILASTARGVWLHEALVSMSDTRLELSGLLVASEVIGLRVLDGNSIRALFDPHEIQDALVTIGAAAPLAPTQRLTRNVKREQFDMVEKLVRAYNRSNPVCISDEFLQNIFGNPSWPKIQRLLVNSGVVSEETRATKGTAKVFLRRQVLPEEIMAGARVDGKIPEQVKKFWDSLEVAFPE